MTFAVQARVSGPADKFTTKTIHPTTIRSPLETRNAPHCFSSVAKHTVPSSLNKDYLKTPSFPKEGEWTDFRLTISQHKEKNLDTTQSKSPISDETQ